MLRWHCLLIALVVLSIGTAARAESPATRLPGHAVAYLHWAGRSLTFDGSMCGQMLTDPNAGRMARFVRDLIVSNAPRRQAAVIESVWDMGELAWQHPTTLALLQLGDPQTGELQLALMIDLGKDREAFARKLNILLQAAEDPDGNAAEAEVTYEQRNLGTPDSPVMVGYMGETFYLAVGKGTAEMLNKPDVADTLAGKTSHAEALANVGGPAGEPLQMLYYVDVEQFKQQANALAGISPEAVTDTQPVIQAMGVDKVSAVAGSWRIVEKGVLSRSWIKTPGPHEGLMSFFDGAPLTEADLARIPADADVAIVVNADPKRIFTQIQRAAGLEGKEAEAELEANIIAIEKSFNLSLDEEVLAALGDTWTLSMADSQGGPLTGIMLTAEVRDEAKLNAALAKVLPKIEQAAQFMHIMQIMQNAHPLQDREVSPETLPSPIQSLQVGEATIQYARFVADDNVAAAVLPAWCVHNKRLYVALWPQTIASALQSQAKPLTAHPDYQRLRRQLDAKANWIIWTNTPQLMRKAYPLMVTMGTLATNQLLKKAVTLQVPPLWPSGLPEMMQYCWPAVTTVRSDEKGITFESYSSHPSLISTTGGALAVTTGVLLPSLHRARENAMQHISMANLQALGTATMMYSVEWDKLPASIDPLGPYLIGSEDAETRILVSPLSGRPAPRFVKGKGVVGEVDYIFIDYTGREDGGKLESFTELSQTLLAYERPENYKPGEEIPILLITASVETVSRERLAELIKQAREAGGKLPAWARDADAEATPE